MGYLTPALTERKLMVYVEYPMLHESEEQAMDTYAVELNSFVDTVLTKVYDLGKNVTSTQTFAFSFPSNSSEWDQQLNHVRLTIHTCYE